MRRTAYVAAAFALAMLAACTSSTSSTSHPAATSRTAGGPPASGTSPAGTGSAAPTTSGASVAAGDGRFTVSFAGDVHFMGPLVARLARDPATVFGPTAAVLRRADFTMVNLETAITTGGVQQDKEYTFRAPPVAFAALRDAGIDLVTMANNHGADYGLPGIRDSLRASRAYHFPVVGLGANADAAFAPYDVTLHGVRVAIFAADQVKDETTLRLFSAGPHSPGVANAYDPRLVRAVHAARAAGYVVIVYLHWGIELDTCPTTTQESLAGRLARAGASAVIGTHAHVLQGAGWERNGTYVAYGLGNYLWWETFDNDQDDNGVLTLDFDRSRVVSAHFAAAHLTAAGFSPPATGAQLRRIDAEWVHDRSCTDLSAHP